MWLHTRKMRSVTDPERLVGQEGGKDGRRAGVLLRVVVVEVPGVGAAETRVKVARDAAREHSFQSRSFLGARRGLHLGSLAVQFSSKSVATRPTRRYKQRVQGQLRPKEKTMRVHRQHLIRKLRVATPVAEKRL